MKCHQEQEKDLVGALTKAKATISRMFATAVRAWAYISRSASDSANPAKKQSQPISESKPSKDGSVTIAELQREFELFAWGIQYVDSGEFGGTVIAAKSMEEALKKFDSLWELELRRSSKGIGIAFVLECQYIGGVK